MLHEIGHDILHRKEAVKAGGFKEFNIFNMQESRMEYEANVFASQVSLGDEEILEYMGCLRVVSLSGSIFIDFPTSSYM